MDKMYYESPFAELVEKVPSGVLCVSGGIDPYGSGNDFIWGNNAGGNGGVGDAGGIGGDFSWGN